MKNLIFVVSICALSTDAFAAASVSETSENAQPHGACHFAVPIGMTSCVDGVTQDQCDSQGGSFSPDQSCG